MRRARRAQLTSLVRRSGLMTVPRGYWWAGVTTTALAVVASSASTSMPSSLTGTGSKTEAFAPQDREVEGEAGLLDGDGGGALSVEQPRHLIKAAGGAGNHGRRVGGRHRVAGSVEVASDLCSQLPEPRGVAVAEQIVGSGRQHLACAAQPCRTRESGGVGLARDQIESEVRPGRVGDGLLGRPRPGCDSRQRAWPRDAR